MTIRQRLTLQFSLIVGILLMGFSFAVYFFSSNYRADEFYTRLKDKAETAARLLLEVEGVDDALLKVISQTSRDLLPEELIMIFETDGTLVFQTKDSPLETHCVEVAKRATGNAMMEDSQDSRQFVAFRFDQGNHHYIVAAAAYDKYGFSKLNFLRTILIIGCVALEVFTIIAGFFYARQALHPINDLIDQIQKISATNISARLVTQNQKDELARLAVEFNHMLDRLEAGYALQRSFVANASHELRTPLTSITGQISVALLEHNINEAGQVVLKSVYQDIRSLNRLANGLLELAQANLDVSGFKLKPVRIDELLGQCQADIRKLMPDAEVIVSIQEFPDDEEDLLVEANAELLASAIGNAIENACKYSDPPCAVVDLLFAGKAVKIRVQDHGIGIPAQDLPYIFEPFFRAGNAGSTRGHGIGLALTRKIVEIQGGTVEIQSQVGEGTQLIITLPTLKAGKLVTDVHA